MTMELTPEILNQKNKGILFGRVASIVLEKGDIQSAIKICEKGIKKYPMYAQGHFILAKCYQKKGMHDEARAEFERVLRYDQNHLRSLKELAEISRDRGLIDIYKEYLFKLYNLEPLNNDIINAIKEIGEYNNWVGTIDKKEFEDIYIKREPHEEDSITEQEKYAVKDQVLEEDIFKLSEKEEKPNFNEAKIDDKYEKALDDIGKVDLSKFENKEDDFTTIMDDIFQQNLEQDEGKNSFDSILTDTAEEKSEKETLAEERPFEFLNDMNEEKTDISSPVKAVKFSGELSENMKNSKPGEKYEDGFNLNNLQDEKTDFINELKNNFSRIDSNEKIKLTKDKNKKEKDNLSEKNFININGDYPYNQIADEKKFSKEEDNFPNRDENKQAEDSNLMGSVNISHLMDELADFSEKHRDILQADDSESVMGSSFTRKGKPVIEHDDFELDIKQDKNKGSLDLESNLDLSPEVKRDNLSISEESNISGAEEDEKSEIKPKIVTQTLGEILVAQKKFEEAKKVFIALKRKNPENPLYDRKIAFLDRIILHGKNE
jgi:hypothetical protein